MAIDKMKKAPDIPMGQTFDEDGNEISFKDENGEWCTRIWENGFCLFYEDCYGKFKHKGWGISEDDYMRIKKEYLDEIEKKGK